MYDRGLGVKNDVKMATKWYEKAAAQGIVLRWLSWEKMTLPRQWSHLAISHALSAAKQIQQQYAKKFY